MCCCRMTHKFILNFKEQNPEVLGKKLKENQKQLEKATDTLQQKENEIKSIKEKLVS